MREGSRALRLTVLVGESDQWRHRPVYAEIVRRARDAGLAGASVFRGLEGFGRFHKIHTSRILSLSEDLPLSIVIIDAEEKIRAFLPSLDEVVTEGVAVVDEVEVVRHFGNVSGDSA
jgi:PII-like signaling protein